MAVQQMRKAFQSHEELPPGAAWPVAVYSPDFFPEYAILNEVLLQVGRPIARALPMAHDAAVTEDELEAEFQRDPKSGLEFLELYFRQNIFAYIKSLCPYTQPHDLAEIYQDTMLRLVKAVQRRSFTPANPMALVLDVAFKAATDFKRRKKVPPIGGTNDVGILLGGDLGNTKAAMEWRYMLKADIPAFQRVLDRALDELPPKQKLAAAVMIELCEEVYDQGSYLPLRERIRAITGEQVTTVQVTDNWRAARAKLAEKLRRAGFDFFQED